MRMPAFLNGSKIKLSLLLVIIPFCVSAQNLILFKNEAGLYGFKNSSGTIVVKPKYMTASPFSEGLAAVWNGKGGYIDVTGSEVIPLQYSITQSFKNGVGKVFNGTEWFYINRSGQRVNPATVSKPVQADGKFSIMYALDKKTDGKLYVNNIITYIQNNGTIANMVDRLNATFKLPYNVYIRFIWMGEINAEYDPNDRSINFSLEMIDFLYSSYQKYYTGSRLDEAVNNSIVFFLFHEVGHALKDIYELPIPGNQESAVDDFACFLLTNRNDDATEKAALDGANSFVLLSKSSTVKAPYWDEHPFDEQRFFYILCKLYGKNPGKYQGVASQYKLPESWQSKCVEGYNDMIKSWKKLLENYFK